MNSEPKIFRPNKVKFAIFFFICSLFVAIGIFIKDQDPMIAWANIIFFGLGAIASLVQFYPNASYLKLTDEGFEVKTIFRSNFTKWSDVKEFSQDTIRGNKMIFFNYTNSHKKHKISKKLAKFLAVKEGVIQSSYNIKTKELLNLMKEYKRKSK